LKRALLADFEAAEKLKADILVSLDIDRYG
jgi:hypothetical protein